MQEYYRYSSSIQWSLGFNASKVTNKILKLPDNGVENNRIGGEYIWDAKLGKHTWQGGLQEGGRIGDLFAYKMIGVYSTDEEAQNANEPIDNVITVPDKPNMVVMQSGKILMVMV